MRGGGQPLRPQALTDEVWVAAVDLGHFDRLAADDVEVAHAFSDGLCIAELLRIGDGALLVESGLQPQRRHWQPCCRETLPANRAQTTDIGRTVVERQRHVADRAKHTCLAACQRDFQAALAGKLVASKGAPVLEERIIGAAFLVDVAPGGIEVGAQRPGRELEQGAGGRGLQGSFLRDRPGLIRIEREQGADVRSERVGTSRRIEYQRR